MNDFTVVPRSQVPPPRSMSHSFPAKLYAALVELPAASVLKVSTRNAKSGIHLRKRLQEIAHKEHVAKTVCFSRSAAGTEFYFWLEAEPSGDYADQ